MCEKCFENEIEQFETGAQFQTFEKELEQKLQENDGPFFLRPSSKGELISYTIYSCKNCQKKWYLQVPDTLNPGFFLEEENAMSVLKQLKKSDNTGRAWVIGICLIIMMICLIVLINNI